MKSVAYLRMSTDKQEYSIESQKREIEAYAKKNGYKIFKFYIDNGISGREASKRPDFLQMVEDSKKGDFFYVIIYDSSRFARNLEQYLVYKSILKQNNVKIISITEPSLDEENQLITDALFGAMNELYSKKLSKVVKRGMAQKALKGEYISCAPFGYFKPKGEGLKVVDNEAKIVKEIYNLFEMGKTAYAIAKILNEREVKTRKGNSIDTRWVKKILTNPTYKGYYKFKVDGNTIFTRANHTPIIDETFFEKIQHIYTQNKKRTKHKEKPIELHKHWLVGLIRCKYCESTFVYAKYYGNRQDRFRCGGYTSGKCAYSFSIGVLDLENIVLTQIKKIFPFKTYKIKVLPQNLNNKKDLLKKIKKYEQALEKAKKAYLMDIDSIEEYSKNKKDILKEIDILLAELDSTEKVVEKAFEINHISNIFQEQDNMIFKNNVAKNLIEKVIIDGKERKIQISFFL